MEQVTINVDIPTPPTINLERNQDFRMIELNTMEVTPSTNYQAMQKVTINPNVQLLGIARVSNGEIGHAYFSDFKYCSGQKLFRLADGEMVVILTPRIEEGYKIVNCQFILPRGDGFMLRNHAEGYYAIITQIGGQNKPTPKFWIFGLNSHKIYMR